jgi:hypothetical protein
VELDPEVIDPLCAAHALALLERLRPFCLSLPEVREVRQFGNPAWQAGKKTFCTVSRYERRLMCMAGRAVSDRSPSPSTTASVFQPIPVITAGLPLAPKMG